LKTWTTINRMIPVVIFRLALNVLAFINKRADNQFFQPSLSGVACWLKGLTT
jgi:hypothetical protein